MSESRKFVLLNEETKRLNVYHLEDMEPYFEDRKDLPSGRVFTTKRGRIALEGLRMLEREYNISWYAAVKKFWDNDTYWNHEMIFYRGNVITAQQAFGDADKLAGALVASGIVKGDEIGCCVSNHPIVPILMLAASKVGAKVNFFGSHYDPVFVEQILNEVTPKLFIKRAVKPRLSRLGFTARLINRISFWRPSASAEGIRSTAGSTIRCLSISRIWLIKPN